MVFHPSDSADIHCCCMVSHLYFTVLLEEEDLDVLPVYLENRRAELKRWSFYFRAHITEARSLGKVAAIREYIMWNMDTRIRRTYGYPDGYPLSEEDSEVVEQFGRSVDALIAGIRKQRRRQVLTVVGRAMYRIVLLEDYIPREVGMHVISF